jgi:hypothetical protein
MMLYQVERLVHFDTWGWSRFILKSFNDSILTAEVMKGQTGRENDHDSLEGNDLE